MMDYDELTKKIIEIIAENLEKTDEIDDITADMDILEDLKADSLNVVEIVMAIQDEFEIEVPDADIPGLKTIRDIVDYVENRLA